MKKANNIDVVIGRNLRAARKANKLRLSDLNGIIEGVSDKQIAKYEVGQNRINSRTMFMLAHVYGIKDLNQLFNGIQKDPLFLDWAMNGMPKVINTMAVRHLKEEAKR